MKPKLLDIVRSMIKYSSSNELSEDDRNRIHHIEYAIQIMPDRKLESDSPDEYDLLIEQATQLEIDFENSHPHLSKLTHQLVKVLSDMGI